MQSQQFLVRYPRLREFVNVVFYTQKLSAIIGFRDTNEAIISDENSHVIARGKISQLNFKRHLRRLEAVGCEVHERHIAKVAAYDQANVGSRDLGLLLSGLWSGRVPQTPVYDTGSWPPRVQSAMSFSQRRVHVQIEVPTKSHIVEKPARPQTAQSIVLGGQVRPLEEALQRRNLSVGQITRNALIRSQHSRLRGAMTFRDIQRVSEMVFEVSD